ncbi:thermonuclease family protein [Oxynema sp. CENA135]|uniref:thermonuclease family protein n=1 Tax=Oxynema sp. CENA135 TaxID=984206 RepID=UPI00190B2DF2|nr:thermonuclease family protein [Oxynema sp. CENA135]MBK4729347.1 thermonuclease family protein [Oxynema sp. CENA135]
MKISPIAIAVGVGLALASCQASETPSDPVVQVDRVTSGQSATLVQTIGDRGFNPDVRAIGIEAPDLDQEPWGPAAQERLAELVGDRPVVLEFDVEREYCYRDRCRQLVYLWQDGTLINERLVKEGYVLASARSPNTKYADRLERAQQWARLMGLGIWNPKNPMRQTPREFRASQREGRSQW